MKATISNGALKDVCGFTKTFLTQVNLLESALSLEVIFGNDKATFRGCNDYASFSTHVKAEVTDSGSCYVDAQLFAKIMSRLPSGLINLELKGAVLEASTSSYTADISTVENIIDYKAMDEPEVMIDGVDVLDAIDSLLWAIDKKSKVLLNIPLDCICLVQTDDGIDVVASDRNVMPVIQMPGIDMKFKRVLIPYKAIGSVQKFNGLENVKVGATNGVFKVENDNRVLYCRAFNSDYIKYNDLYSKVTSPQFTLNLTDFDFASVLQRVGILFSGKYYAVDLRYEAGLLHVSSKGEGGQIAEVIEIADAPNEDFNISINNMYFSNAVTTAGETIYLDYIGNQKPIVIRNDSEYKCMISQIVGAG